MNIDLERQKSVLLHLLEADVVYFQITE